MADERARFEWRAFNTSLTTRILAVNLIPLILLAGSLFFLDSYRRQLLNERFNLARIEAQITAEALAGASRTRQEALLIQIGREQRMRLRMFDAEGDLLGAEFRAENSAGEELALTAFVVPPFLTAHPAFSTHPPATCLASGATTVSSRCRVGMGNVRSSSPNPARSR